LSAPVVSLSIDLGGGVVRADDPEGRHWTVESGEGS
jgi:hypothetical protein